ncbi:MAG: undecaprenyl-diphosphate phosphatase [DPANN group archaeon]|nr:undecaprenyl-diphosphate phosphatase [DPANN group archaeon]
MLTLLEAVVLGIVQGIAEWLPISSEGMTSLIMINFFGKSISDALPMSIWLHIGTMLAAIVFLRKDVMAIVRNLPGYVKKQSFESNVNATTTFLIITTFLTGVVGLPMIVFAIGSGGAFSGKVATAFIGLFLIVTGVLQRKAKGGVGLLKRINNVDSIIVGIAQGFSAIPGISRSGITVSALLFRGFTAEKALRLSFLMSVPAVFVAEVGLGVMGLLVFDVNSIVALLFSFVFGFLTIGALFKVAGKIDFSWFCIILGALSVFAFFV